MNHQNTITLWSVIESMQNRLEKQGLEPERVDAAIMRRLRALMTRRSDEPAVVPART